MRFRVWNVLKPEKGQKQDYQTPQTISISDAIVVVIIIVVVVKRAFYSRARPWNAVVALGVYQRAVLLEIGKGSSDIISLLTV